MGEAWSHSWAPSLAVTLLVLPDWSVAGADKCVLLLYYARGKKSSDSWGRRCQLEESRRNICSDTKLLFFQVPITWDSLWTSFTSLEELNIRVCVENIINVYNQSNLSKLALPTCILQGTGITSTSRATASYSVMKVLVETCPNIKEFEFTPCITCVYSPAFKDQELSLILLQNWKQLRRIKLSGLPCVLSGKSFQQIFTSCEKLESISLKHLGLDGKCGYLTELYKSLSCCRNLKDFRIEQPNIISLDVLILALAKCPLLERICIISLRHSKLSHYRVLRDLVVELPNLIFLCVVMDILTKERCKVISKDITERCKAARPSLHVMLHHCALTAEFLVDIPGVHYFEMVEDVSQICTKPGNGGRYKYLFHT